MMRVLASLSVSVSGSTWSTRPMSAHWLFMWYTPKALMMLPFTPPLLTFTYSPASVYWVVRYDSCPRYRSRATPAAALPMPA